MKVNIRHAPGATTWGESQHEVDSYDARDGMLILTRREALGLGGPWRLKTKVFMLRDILDFSVEENV